MGFRASKGFLIFLLVAACDPAAPAGGNTPGPAENQVLFEGLRVDRYESDQLRYRARLERATLDRASGRVRGEGLSGLVAKSGATVTAPRLTSELRSRLVELSGGVTAKDRLGRTLRAESLRYDERTDRLETSSPVHVDGPNFSATGDRLTGRPRAGQLQVEGSMTATVTGIRMGSSRGTSSGRRKRP